MNVMHRQMILAGLKAGLGRLAMTMAQEECARYDRDTYICYAIDIAATENECTSMEAKSAQDHIEKMLGNHTTVRHYLRDELKVPSKQLNTKNVQAFRSRWVESMIKEFS